MVTLGGSYALFTSPPMSWFMVLSPLRSGQYPISVARREFLQGAEFPSPGPGSTRGGAYGFRWLGLPDEGLITPAPLHWPEAKVTMKQGPEQVPRGFEMNERRASISLLGGGLMEARRAPLEATYLVADSVARDELIHPYLAPAAGVFASWLGYESFHAGGLVVDGGVWGVLGDKEKGKSSLLAWFAQDGQEVFTDDLLIVSGTMALAGPRCIDLRPEAAQMLEGRDPTSLVRGGTRDRLFLNSVESELEMRGWLYLEWGSRIEIEPVAPSERLSKLAGFRGLPRVPTDPSGYLRLGVLPAFEVSRPRRWEVMPELMGTLTDALVG